MKKNVLVALITPFLCLTGCKSSSKIEKLLDDCLLKEPVLSNVSKPDNYLEFLGKVSAFSNKFTCEVLKTKDNVTNYAISPVSVFFALALAAESTSGETRNEILKALNLTYGELENNIQYFINSLNQDFEYDSYQGTKKYGKVSVTNSIWYQKGFTVKQALLELLSNRYYSYEYQVDFLNNNKEANQLIREFVKKQTNGLIDRDLEIDVSTLVLLLNTVYFKDVWNDYGRDLNFTKDNYLFKAEDSTTKETKLLVGCSNGGRANYQEDYKSFYTKTVSGASLVFIVPGEGKTLANVFTEQTIIDALSTKYVYQDDEKMERYFTSCYFPEFNASYDGSLREVLKDGFKIEKLFDIEKSDFTNTTDEKLFVGDVRHVTKLNVDKTGIEGAAITAMSEYGSSAPIYKDVFETFIVDRSFGYIISYNGAKLFTGVVQKI